MTVVEAVVAGVVQGLTEFLPVSSSGHLIVFRWLFGIDDLPADTATAFDAAVHVGTLVGATAFLRVDVSRYLRAGLGALFKREKLGADGRIAWALVVSMLPAAAVGLLAGGQIAAPGGVVAVAVALIVFGLVMGLADRAPQKRGRSEFGFTHALIMGTAQALALQPGVSRSGATLSAARLLGYQREAAVRLAFLMSLPVIAGAGLYSLVELDVPNSLWPALLWGAASALITGWLSVWATIRVVARLGLAPFVIYRLVAGLAILLMAATPLR